MNTRANRRIAEEEIDDGGVPPQGVQGGQSPLGVQENEVSVVPPNMTNGEISEDFLSLALAMTTQANRDVIPRVIDIESIVASRLRDFTRMNHCTFLGSKVDEDPQNFIEEVFKIVDAMGVTPMKKAELISYQLKDVAQVWFEKWRDERPIVSDPMGWGVFKTTFLDRFFPLELREKKLVEFMNLRQENISVKEYSLKFTEHSKYSPTLVENSRARMNKCVMGISGLVKEECRTAMLHHDMDIFSLMVYAHQLEETKLRKMNRDMKRARPDEQNQSRSMKRFYKQDSSMVNNDRVSNHKPKRGNGGGSTFERTRCATWGK
ncbi:uncharacterized protein LOC125861453 [Solanum stenotomum]|uniref:uncharacterized protein LOC125861453 n=1 Tax=Solanum stenotomum TaxID=172797 RepID=UPI0020D0A29E|nr:uncharacterized protein LOC125861453 [Solanum stenotomum]